MKKLLSILKNINSKKITHVVILISTLLIAISIGYYYLIFLPQKQIMLIKNDCVDRVLKEIKEEYPKKINNFRKANDRGCFIKAGGMNDVYDDHFKPKFNDYNKEYYNTCLAEIMKQVEKKEKMEKSKRIEECVDLYSN